MNPSKQMPFQLQTVDGRLSLVFPESMKMKPYFVDFTSGVLTYRRKHGGGRKQLIARAVGIKPGVCLPSILDATAGFGRDAFVLASLGCRVHMRERSGVIGALLADGLQRAGEDPRIGAWVRERMSLTLDASEKLPFKPDVVYLDPMYPARRNSARVKKEMLILKLVVGEDPDADRLLEPALATARSRVSVKRPAYAGWLAGCKPDANIESKNHRFDIYLTR